MLRFVNRRDAEVVEPLSHSYLDGEFPLQRRGSLRVTVDLNFYVKRKLRNIRTVLFGDWVASIVARVLAICISLMRLLV